MQDRKTILVVDDAPADLKLVRSALASHYDVMTAPNADKMFDILATCAALPDLILLEVGLPETDGHQALQILQSDKLYETIPVIFLTHKGDKQDECDGLSLGAADYIAKPFLSELLLKRINRSLSAEAQKKKLLSMNAHLHGVVRKKTLAVRGLQNSILSIVSELVENRDDCTGRHICRTARTLEALIAGLTKWTRYAEELEALDVGLFLDSSQLHDVGKIAIRDDILLKPDRLTEEEFDVMKMHVSHGVNIIDQIRKQTTDSDFLSYARIMIETHHEKWDGSGYPRGLSGNDIHLYGRMMAIADVYDALISDRPYKKAYSQKDALRIILESSGTHFDPVIAGIFPEIIQACEYMN